MANPVNQTNTTIPKEIYDILLEIKQRKGCTFDEVLDQLCELEFQNDYPILTQEYNLFYGTNPFTFVVEFREDDMTIKYKTRANEMTTDISEWGVPNKVQKEFHAFISEEHSRCILEHITPGLIFNNFEIYKAGRLWL